MEGKRIRRIAKLLVVIAGLGSASVPACWATDATSSDSLGPVVTGELDSIDSLLTANEGKWVIVNVWATWCRPCVVETPDLVAFAHRINNERMTIIGLSTDYFRVHDTTAMRRVSAFQTKHAIPYANLVFTGTKTQLTKRLELSGMLPTTIVFNPSGKIVEQFIGIIEKDDLDDLAERIGRGRQVK